MRFNPPPNWPRFPNGWTPPPGWQPDPSWPPPPYGWRLWVNDGEPMLWLPPTRAPFSPHQVPWHQRTIAVTLFLIFFFPVGLVLLWLRQDWSVRRRGWITGVVAVVVIIAASTSNPQPVTAIQAGPAAGSSSSSPSVTPSGASTSPSNSAAAVLVAPPKTSAPPRTTAAPTPTTQSPEPPPPATTQAPTTQAATTQAAQQKSTCGAPSNPYGYNFCGTGGDITSPASDVCSYFNCIDYFSHGHGYMIECRDGKYSMSGGISGACSSHHGVEQPVYSG
jgi:hypothetical protein